MFTYQIQIEYLGTNFVGWQIQKNGISVQETLEEIFSKFLNDKIKIFGSGRTDAGVHASGQSAHFKTKYKILDKNDWYFKAHWKNDPNLPGMLQIEALLQMSSLFSFEYKTILFSENKSNIPLYLKSKASSSYSLSNSFDTKSNMPFESSLPNIV